MMSWTVDDLDDDLRPRMARLLAQDRPFALVTTHHADGGPRGVGAQMVVTDSEYWGFVSGGCIEADVARHARATLADGVARPLVYGRGSPWIDLPLPCGGRLELMAERIAPDDDAITAFVAAYGERQAVRYRSDGVRRRCGPDLADADRAAEGGWVVDHRFIPVQRLIVVGSDPVALAIAALGQRLGWTTTMADADDAADLAPDAWTAVAVATHDLEQDERAILAALAGDAGYIGVLGARRRIPDRVVRLRERGATEADLARLHMPIGLPLRAATPWEIAVSVTAQIIAERRA